MVIGRPLKTVVRVTPRPSGTVHCSPSGASQFAEIIGAKLSAYPLPKLKLMNGCRLKKSTSGSPPASLIGQSWLTRPPSTNGPGIASTTALMPPAHVPVLVGAAVDVGSDSIGPTPQ